MKVLVTGGAGFIASHVVDAYVKEGFEVVVVDDLSTGRLSNLNPEVTFYKLDIRSPQLAEVFKKEKPDYINHHAAQMDVRRSVVDPLFDANVNILGSINLIECAKSLKSSVLSISQPGELFLGNPNTYPAMNFTLSIQFVNMALANTR